MTRFAVFAMVVATLAGCDHRSNLRPRLILQGDDVGDQFWLSAPYVLAIRVIHATPQGSAQSEYPGGPKSLQLFRFEATVENVIKGDLSDKLITFLFFAKLDQNPDYVLVPGRHYIVSLRSEGGILRSWADATQLKIEFQSGSHDQKDLPLDKGPAVTIAYILVTPGSDCDLTEFANKLSAQPMTYAESYAGPGYVYERLQQLQHHPNQYVREAACFSVATIFWIHPPCFQQLLGSPGPQAREAVRKHLSEDNLNLSEELRDHPEILGYPHV